MVDPAYQPVGAKLQRSVVKRLERETRDRSKRGDADLTNVMCFTLINVMFLTRQAERSARNDGPAAGLPRLHTAGELRDIGVAGVGERRRRDGRHVARLAVQQDRRRLAAR